jgi:hypothetical protein
MPARRRLRLTRRPRPDSGPSSRRTSRLANGCRGGPRRSNASRSQARRSRSRWRLASHRRLHGRARSRRRRRLGDGFCCRRGRRRRNRSRVARREQRQRIDIAAGIVCTPDPELDVRLLRLRVSAGPDRPDRLGLGDAVSDRDDDRTEVSERHGPAVGGPDRDGLPVRRQRAGEAHTACGGCKHSGVESAADVDSPMTRRGVCAAAVIERTEDLTRSGPRPAPRPRRSEQGQGEEHCCQSCEHRDGRSYQGCRLLSKAATARSGRAGSAERP